MSNPESNDKQVPPVPQYGEYAPTPPPYQPTTPQPQQPYSAQYGQQPQYVQQDYYGQPYLAKRPLRTADTIISVILLIIAFFSVLFMMAIASQLEGAMQQQYDSYGLGDYQPNGTFMAVQATLIVSHVVLLLIAAPITIVLITKRVLSFWVPLSAGVLAAIVFWVALIVLMVSDPALMDVIQQQSQTP